MINSKKNNPKYNRTTRKKMERICRKYAYNVPLCVGKWYSLDGPVRKERKFGFYKFNSLEFESFEDAAEFTIHDACRIHYWHQTERLICPNIKNPIDDSYALLFTVNADAVSFLVKRYKEYKRVVAMVTWDGKRHVIQKH